MTAPMPFTVSVWQCAAADAMARFASISAKAVALLASHVHVGGVQARSGLTFGGLGREAVAVPDGEAAGREGEEKQGRG